MATAHPPLGIIGSSGGSALAAAAACLQEAGIEQPWVVVTDRPCGLSEWAGRQGHPVRVFAYEGTEDFSAQALDFLLRHGAGRALLFYTRKVARPLIDGIAVSNIHPSLLPEFPGLAAVRKAWAAGRGMLGATLHRVDEGVDTGPVTIQVASRLPAGATREMAERISHLQKAWLTLHWQQGLDATALMDPRLLAAFSRLQARLDCLVDVNSVAHPCA